MQPTLPSKRPRSAPTIRSDQEGSLQRFYPASSAISVVVYDSDTKNCWVSFRDGTTVELSDFSEIELHRWMGADSAGNYWNKHIRGRY